MGDTCKTCKHGHDTKPAGQKPSAGTVWCSVKQLQMGANRVMQCFLPRAGAKPKRCVECKRAKMQKPSGEVPQVGHVWCDKRHIEIPKGRTMECFE